MPNQLTESDRAVLAQLLQLKMPKQEIAKRLRKHRSTVYRELARNTSPIGYIPEEAQPRGGASLGEPASEDARTAVRRMCASDYSVTGRRSDRRSIATRVSSPTRAADFAADDLQLDSSSAGRRARRGAAACTLACRDVDIVKRWPATQRGSHRRSARHRRVASALRRLGRRYDRGRGHSVACCRWSNAKRFHTAGPRRDRRADRAIRRRERPRRCPTATSHHDV